MLDANLPHGDLVVETFLSVEGYRRDVRYESCDEVGHCDVEDEFKEQRGLDLLLVFREEVEEQEVGDEGGEQEESRQSGCEEGEGVDVVGPVARPGVVHYHD